MSGPNDTRSRETEDELRRAQKAADRINCRIAFDYTIEFRSDFVGVTFPVDRAFVGEYSLFIDAGDYGEIAVAPEHYHCFLGVDLSDLGKRDSGSR
jgi:hypothetical protein